MDYYKYTPGIITLISILIFIIIILICILTKVFSHFNLSNKEEALGFPRGSVRAIIALSIVLIYAFLAVFLYQGVSSKSDIRIINYLNLAQRDDLLKLHPLDFQSIKIINDSKNNEEHEKNIYQVSYSSPNSASSDDFAKQILTFLGVLMTSVTSYYLAAKTATSAATAGSDLAVKAAAIKKSPSNPIVTAVNSPSITIAANDAIIKFSLVGHDLNDISHVKLINNSDNSKVIMCSATSNQNNLSCSCNVTPEIRTLILGNPQRRWNILIDDGSSSWKYDGLHIEIS